MRDVEKILKAFANKRRIAIVKYLKQHKEAPVADIAHEIGLSFKATSKHLVILFNAEILEREQKNLQMFYRIAHPIIPLARSIINHL